MSDSESMYGDTPPELAQVIPAPPISSDEENDDVSSSSDGGSPQPVMPIVPLDTEPVVSIMLICPWC